MIFKIPLCRIHPALKEKCSIAIGQGQIGEPFSSIASKKGFLLEVFNSSRWCKKMIANFFREPTTNPEGFKTPPHLEFLMAASDGEA